MAESSRAVDHKFYAAADGFFSAHAGTALTYDDVTLATQYSEVLPRDTILETELHERLRLRLPIISADMAVMRNRFIREPAAIGGNGRHPFSGRE